MKVKVRAVNPNEKVFVKPLQTQTPKFSFRRYRCTKCGDEFSAYADSKLNFCSCCCARLVEVTGT